MKINISSKLDPIFETIGLLSVSHHFNDHKKSMIEALTELGLDGESFYKNDLKIYEKYVQTFTKNRVDHSQANFFFGDEDTPFFLLLVLLLTENKNWLSSLDEVTDEKIRIEILNSAREIFDNDLEIGEIKTLEQMIEFLDQSLFEESVKWKLLTILQQPKRMLAALVEMINDNIPAFEKSEGSIEKMLEKPMNRFFSSVEQQKDTQFYRNREVLAKDSMVIPGLIAPISQLMFKDKCYYGLFIDSVLKIGQDHKYSQEALLLKIKALSDKSKFQILGSLKVSPKYNLEIAEELGLTAATMSHHMSVLLACGLVCIDKKQGKVYYHLESETIKQFIEELSQLLL